MATRGCCQHLPEAASKGQLSGAKGDIGLSGALAWVPSEGSLCRTHSWEPRHGRAALMPVGPQTRLRNVPQTTIKCHCHLGWRGRSACSWGGHSCGRPGFEEAWHAVRLRSGVDLAARPGHHAAPWVRQVSGQLSVLTPAGEGALSSWSVNLWPASSAHLLARSRGWPEVWVQLCTEL